MNSPFRNLRIQALGNYFACLLVFFLVIAVGAAAFTYREVQKIHADLDRADTSSRLRTAILGDIQHNLGYGDLIDDLKNFVSKKDTRFAISFYAKLLGITFSLDAFEELAAVDHEQDLVKRLRRTTQYYARLARNAETMISNASPPREIGATIPINDGPVLEALALLNSAQNRLRAERGLSTQRFIASTGKVTMLAAGAVVLLLLGLAVAILQTFRVRLLRPLVSLKSAMNALALGDYYIQIPGRDKPDELGHMAKAVEIFRRNRLEVASLRKTQALAETRAGEAEFLAAEEKHRRIVAQERTRRKIEETRRAELAEEVAQKTLALRRNEARTGAIIDSMLDAVIIANEEGEISDFSRAAELIFGFSADEIIGKNLTTLIPEYIASTREDRDGLPRTSGDEAILCSDLKSKGRRKNGDFFPLNLSLTELNYQGEVILIAVARDISEEIRNEEKLQRLGRFINWSKREVYVYDAKTLEIMEANATALQNLGYLHEEMDRLTLLDLAPGLNRESLEAFQNQLKDDAQQQLIFETVFQKKNGDTYPVEIQLHYRRAEVPPAFFVLAMDISDRLEARQALMLARNEAENANRVQSAFLANMSHELRTPLNAVIGYSELLMEIAEENGLGEFLEDLRRISDAGLHLLSLIDDVLDLSKIEAGKAELEIQKFSVPRMVEEAASIIRPQMEKNGNKLHLRMADDIGDMWSDPIRVRQVLFNVLSNAAKFTQGGLVEVSVFRAITEITAEIIFEVTDNGIGIAPDRLGRLFGDFIQADESTARKYGGTGLGLAISRRLCRLMSGDIEAESELRKGSTFTIRLPADLRQNIVPFRQDKPDHSATCRTSSFECTAEAALSNKVLVVEDNGAMRRLIETYLETSGYEVELASTLKEGLGLLEASRPFLVILDLVLPDGNGLALLEEIRQSANYFGTRVIICSSMDRCRSREVDKTVSQIVKPINKNELLSVVTEITSGMPARRVH